jgi:hypothetical protein
MLPVLLSCDFIAGRHFLPIKALTLAAFGFSTIDFCRNSPRTRRKASGKVISARFGLQD